VISLTSLKADARRPIPDHAEFVTEWFPESAASAIHLELNRSKVLATHAHGGLARFKLTQNMLDLIRSHTGIDPILVDQLTTANITTGRKGTIIFFTTSEKVPFGSLAQPGFAPAKPEIHKFKGKQIYHYPGGDRPLGVYSPDGYNFIIGDWTPFKTTLLGNRDGKNNLVDSLISQVSPIVICSAPRLAEKRWRKEDLFGTVTVIDFDETLLVLQMEEEHPTPADATVRQKAMETELPADFESAYGFQTKDRIRYVAKADGRNALFGMQGPIEKVEKLLDHMLGGTVAHNPRALAKKRADEAIKLVRSASADGVRFTGARSPDDYLTALARGMSAPNGKSFKLPYMTIVERSMVSEFLVSEAGSLTLVPESELPVEPENTGFDMKQLRRSAREVAALTMSAASADCEVLKRTDSTGKIIELLCSEGLSGSGVYAQEHFQGPALSEAEQIAIAELLVKSNGYLVYRPNGK